MCSARASSACAWVGAECECHTLTVTEENEHEREGGTSSTMREAAVYAHLAFTLRHFIPELKLPFLIEVVSPTRSSCAPTRLSFAMMNKAKFPPDLISNRHWQRALSNLLRADWSPHEHCCCRGAGRRSPFVRLRLLVRTYDSSNLFRGLRAGWLMNWHC